MGQLAPNNYHRPYNSPRTTPTKVSKGDLSPNTDSIDPKATVILIVDKQSYAGASHNITPKLAQNTIKTALRNLWESYSYLQKYCNYLQGYYSEEEFSEVAELHAQETRSIDFQTLIHEIAIIVDVFNETLDTDDLAEILNVDVFKVKHALSIM